MVLFGAVAVVGLLGVGIMSFMKGPLQTAVKVTRQNTAEAQMNVAGQVAVMAAANAPGNGDCDSDGFVEPLEFRDAGSNPKPVGGGYIPNTIGISKKDPWGTEYGYCVWDHGSVLLNASCQQAAPGTNRRLEGYNAQSFPVVAIISAGSDKTFTTTCRNFSTGADRADQNNNGVLTDSGDRELVGKAAATDDDIIFTYTYQEATGVGGGLWSLKTGDPTKATISKSLEVAGGATFQGTGTFQRLAATGSDYLELLSGLKLANPTGMPTCNATNSGVMRRNVAGTGLEVCDGVSTWNPIGGASEGFSQTATCTAPTDAGKVKYDSGTGQPMFCNGVSWQPFALASPTAQLVISPAANYSMDVAGPCTSDCPDKYGSYTTFTVRNSGTTATSVLGVPSITGSNPTNFQMDLGTSTCDNGIALAASGSAGNSCTIVLRPVASGNTTYAATINVTAGALNITAPIYGVGSGFGCLNGARGWGGIVVGTCTGNGGTEPGTGQLVFEEPGCGTGTFEPTCTNNYANDGSFPMGTNFNATTYIFPQVNSSDGAQNTANILGYGQPNNTWPAVEYCNNLTKGGYDNWYLPSSDELAALWSNTTIRATMPGSGYYKTSTTYSSSYRNGWNALTLSNGGISNGVAENSLPVRCLRKHNVSLPTAQSDNNPEYYYDPASSNWSTSIPVAPSYAALNAQATGRLIYVSGINQNVNFTITGAGSPGVKVDGAAAVASGTLTGNANHTIELIATATAAVGGEAAVTLTIGPDVATWKVRTYDAALVKKIFVTSSVVDGNFSGLAGADQICQQRAASAGLASAEQYHAVIRAASGIISDRFSWKTGRWESVDGTLISDNPDDFWTKRKVAGPINKDENGGTRTGFAWTGDQGPGNGETWDTTGSNICNSWTSNAGTINGFGTNIGALTSWPGNGYVLCNVPSRFMCMGPNPELPSASCGSIIRTYSEAGTYTFTVPAGCLATFKMWGAGGGAMGYSAGRIGGGGGYTYFTETPGVNQAYTIVTGTAGQWGQTAGTGYFSGGQGGYDPTNGWAGAGGSATVLFRGSNTSGTLLAVSAGGGGSGFSGSGSPAGSGSWSTTQSNGINGAADTGAGGAGYDGATGGGGLTNAGGGASGGKNWTLPGGSTLAGSGSNPGNSADSTRPTGTGGCASGSFKVGQGNNNGTGGPGMCGGAYVVY